MFVIEIEGEGREELLRDEMNAIYDAVRAGFEAARSGMKLLKDL